MLSTIKQTAKTFMKRGKNRLQNWDWEYYGLILPIKMGGLAGSLYGFKEGYKTGLTSGLNGHREELPQHVAITSFYTLSYGSMGVIMGPLWPIFTSVYILRHINIYYKNDKWIIDIQI